MAGASVRVTGKIVSDDDIRADVWCKFDSDVTGGGDAYLGEFTTINGKITVEGDLDIGKDVKLNGGFLSKGWIVVRNPLPIMVFIFLYIRELMRLGRTSEEIDKTLGELFEDDEEIDLEKLDEANLSDVLNRGGFFVIPIGSKMTPESINVPEDTVVGSNCVINTRLICKRFEGGKNLTFCGVLRSKGETLIDDGSRIDGEIIASGKLIIGKDVKITGTVSAKSVIIHETSFVEGKVSSGHVRFAKGSGFEVKDHTNPEKAELLSKADSFDLIQTNIIERKEEETEADETETSSEKETEKQPAEENISAAESVDGTDAMSEEGTPTISKDDSVAISEEGNTTDSKDEAVTISEDGVATVSKDEGAAISESSSAAVSKDDSAIVSKDKTTDETEPAPAQKMGARAKRRSSRKAKQNQVNKLEIINVFTGENIETVKPEKEETSEQEETPEQENA